MTFGDHGEWMYPHIDELTAKNAELSQQLAQAQDRIKKLEAIYGKKNCTTCAHENSPDKCEELQCFGNGWTAKGDSDA